MTAAAAGRSTPSSPPRARRTTPAPTSRPSRAAACRPGRRSWSASRTPAPSSARRSRSRAADPAAARRRGEPAGRRAARWTPRRSTRRRVAPARLRPEHGGFTRSAPKFPPRRRSSSCCAAASAAMALHTLRAMASGGMYDQVGGGFSRYSVDARWVDPALREDALRQRAARPRVPARLPGRRASRSSRACAPRRSTGRCATCARTRAASPRRSTPTPRARRASSTSGRRTRCARVAGRRALADAAIAHFGLDGPPNFEGRWAPVRATRDPDGLRGDQGAPARRPRAARVAGARRQAADGVERADDLGAGRRRRGARAPDYTDAAVACAEFLWRDLRDADGRLLRTYNRGQARLGAYLEDHAFLLEAMLTLYETTFDPRWFAAARELADTILERFADREHGGFFATADDHEDADRAAQGARGHADPGGRLGRRLRAAAPRGADRRARLRGGGARRAAAAPRRRAAASRRVRARAPGARLPLRRRQGGGDRRAGRRAAGARRARRVPPAPRRRRRPRRAASRCSRAARRWTAAPPHTCASTSPAGAR